MRLFGVVLMFAVLGCSGDDSAGAGSSDSGPGSAGTGGQAMGAGGQNSGTAGAAGASSSDAATPSSDAAVPTSSGQVVLYAPPSLDFTSYGANFTDPAHPQPDFGCMATVYGMCSVSTCPYPQPTEAPRPHAGSITFTSPDITGTATITPDTNGLYPTDTPTGVHFTGGETVLFNGQGDTVPAFNETVTYPLLLLMSAPAMPAGATAPAMVPRTKDLVLTWTRGEADIVLQIQATKIVGTSLHFFDCSVPSLPGTFTIPKAALQAIGTSADFTIGTFRRHTFQDGGYTIDIFVGGNVLTPDKMRAIAIQVQ